MKILIAFRQSAKRDKLKKNEITRVCLVFLCTQTDVLNQGLTLRPTFRLTLCDKDKINDLIFFSFFFSLHEPEIVQSNVIQKYNL